MATYHVRIEGEVDAPSVEFQVGNPRVEVLTGVLRLFRSRVSSSDEESKQSTERSWLQLSTETILELNLTLLGFVSLPPHIGPLELIEFSKAFRSDIVLIRLLRDARHPSRLALVQFTSAIKAAQFYEAFNGTQFNSIEPDRCSLVFVQQIEFVPSQPASAIATVNGHSVASGMLPPDGLVEIPTCPVCLDRLDASASGILTTLCNHTFHCDCLFRWEGSSCPVCRFSHGDIVSTCEVCETTEHLWICLICGHVGCGRYSNEHAKQHYQETLHAYSLELETQRVWDYAGDGYVHRLILNKQDGKFVEFPNPNACEGQEEEHIKLEKLAAEYNLLLTSQLEEQRMFYERKLAAMDDSTEHRVLEQEKKSLKRQNELLLKKTRQLEEELVFVRELNKSLIENQKSWKERVQAAEDKCAALEQSTQQRVDDLEAQIKDLMFYLDTQNKVENSVHKREIQDGSLHTVVQEKPPTEDKKPRKHKKRG